MAKNKWLMALLLLGVVGVLAYNLHFFTGRDQKNSSQPTAPTDTSAKAPPENAVPHSIEPAISNEAAALSGQAPASIHPSWSMEQLRMEATKTMVESKVDLPRSVGPWALRDPFREQKSPAPAAVAVLSSKVESSPPVEPPEPSHILSAILVQGDRRYALIDGNLRKIDSNLAGGKVVAIEPDHVLLKTAKGIKKLALGPAFSAPVAPPAENRAGS